MTSRSLFGFRMERVILFCRLRCQFLGNGVIHIPVGRSRSTTRT
jgi:hypothetical protein